MEYTPHLADIIHYICLINHTRVGSSLVSTRYKNLHQNDDSKIPTRGRPAQTFFSRSLTSSASSCSCSSSSSTDSASAPGISSDCSRSSP
mmetsp:Transcript_10679/g.39903  ORF Transcript_10679/g.39903 Transcript_10679/m.39903 type:complete len:90 (-) Transcript_10679:2385-2654(-)